MKFYQYVIFRQGIGSLPKIIDHGITVADNADNALKLAQKHYKRADYDNAAVSEIKFDARDDK